MKVGYDFQPAVGGRNTGIGRYTEELFLALSSLHDPPFEILQLRRRSEEPLSGSFRRFLWEQVELPILASRRKVDLLHSTGFSTPLWGKFKRVVTVHDVLPLKVSGEVGVFSRIYWRNVVFESFLTADAAVFVSRWTMGEFCRLFPNFRGKKFVVYEGVSRKVHRDERKYNGLDDYLLFVGSLVPRKNPVFLVRMLAEMKEKVRLVLVGDGPEKERVLAEAENLGVANRVLLLGYLSDEALSRLYTNALLFVFPSLAEGFGLPPLESLKCGTLPVVSDIEVMREVYGEALPRFSPTNPRQAAELLDFLLSHPAEVVKWLNRARSLLEIYTWERAAKKLSEIYSLLLS